MVYNFKVEEICKGERMLPEKFLSRMKNILGDEYADFENALSCQNVRGVRVNTSKISVENFLEATALTLEKIPYASDGFIPEEVDGIGKGAEHHSGMFYVQDPGAMATVKALDIKPGWRVLDACAAPGGKASQLASAVGDEGFLLANEFVPKRAKIIVGNLERLGIKNAVVTSLDTAKLAEMFSSYFDLVLCDAPCSGEGMFRKCDEAVSEWSEENVLACAKRQTEILENCQRLVKAGGYLLYSTCTYSVEENEGVVKKFLENHPEFSLCEVKEELKRVTSAGLLGLDKARRFYPHKSKGEGQFIALLKKDENSGNLPTILYKESLKPLSKADEAIARTFLKENLNFTFSGRLVAVGEQISMVSHDIPLPPYSVFMAGVLLGEVKKGILFPHHQFFSAYGADMKCRLELRRGDSRVEKYLRGEEIDTDLKSGWCAVIYEGVALGGGKVSGGRVKNHYPKGLRNK